MNGKPDNEMIKAYFTKIVGLKKGSTDLYFEFKEKNEDTGKYEVLDDKDIKIGGYLVGIGTDEREFEGDVIQSVKLFLKDVENELLVVFGIGLNNISRSLINGLLGTANLNGWWELKLYRNKENGYPNLYVTVDGNRLDWKYNYAEDFKPKISTVKQGRKTLNDYTELNEWLFDQVKELGEKFKPEGVPEVEKKSSSISASVATGTSTKTDVSPEPVEEEDDLPF